MSDRFTASIKWSHADEVSALYFRAKNGDRTLTDADIALLGNFAGALNSARAAAGPTIDVRDPIPFGDYERRFWYARTDVITVFPFTMPATGLLHICDSENSGQPWLRLMTVSTTPGDLSAPIRSAGKVTDIYLTGGVEFPPGTPLFANTTLTEEPSIPNSSRSGISIVWGPAA